MQPGDRFKEALCYAVDLHATQVRKGGGVPYVSHLLAVTAIAIEHGADEEVAIAALLHDAVEDAGGWTRLKDIRTRFGSNVADIVASCTDAFERPKPPWRRRKEAFLDKLRDASKEARLVVAADKLHNVRSLIRDYRDQGESIWKQFNASREESLWFHRSVAEVLRRVDDSPLVAELDRAVCELQELCRDSK